MDRKENLEFWIRNRRSTFLNGLQPGGRIDRSVIEKLLDLAVWAPTHGLAQTWQFKVFSGSGLEKLYLKQQQIYKISTPPERFNQEKHDRIATKSECVSYVIAVLCKRDPRKRFPRQEDLVAAACAMQNMYLALQSFGIAGYLSTGDVCYDPAMRNYLQLDEEDACIGFLTLGIAREGYIPPERKRLPASEKTEWMID